MTRGPCYICGGSFWEYGESCYNCNGSGVSSGSCHVCLGSGTVPALE